jgi:hypothetical protein
MGENRAGEFMPEQLSSERGQSDIVISGFIDLDQSQASMALLQTLGSGLG